MCGQISIETSGCLILWNIYILPATLIWYAYYSYLGGNIEIHGIRYLFCIYSLLWELRGNMPWQHIHSNNLFLHCFVADSEERPVVIQGKEIVCLLFHQPSLFETVIWWNVIQTSGPKDAVIYQSSLLFCIHQFVDIM